MRNPSLVVVISCLVMQTACTGERPVTSTVQSTAASTVQPTQTSTAAGPAFIDEIVLGAPSSIGPRWSLAFALPYGDGPDQLGTSLGGDGEGVQWGPDYGTQLPDGSWWFLDAAHLRLAQFSDTGQYLSELILPKRFLADGRYFQYASPFALADGTLVLTGTSIDAASLLLVSPDRTLTRVPLAEWVGPQFTDGRQLYGFTPESEQVRIDPRTGQITPVTAFTGQSGDSFIMQTAAHSLRITRGDTTRSVPVSAADAPSLDVHPWIQAAMGSDGVLSMLVSGTVEETIGEARTVAGFVTVDPQGRISPVESVPDPFSASDPGGGSHVGVRQGDTNPWLMFVDTDALRVYRRS